MMNQNVIIENNVVIEKIEEAESRKDKASVEFWLNIQNSND